MANVALQADVGSIPSNSLTLVENLGPFLRAVSADNVDGLAVVQVESIGACFLVNGDFADKVPELLVRSSVSLRLKRLSVLVGWMAGDTSSMMATTAPGRAASLLCNLLVELYDACHTGQILHMLSRKTLPADNAHSSCDQLSRVAAILSNKLRPLSFGSHLASQVTRIRLVYESMGFATPRTLLDHLSTETMAEFCFFLHRALHEEGLKLFVDGCFGLGNIVSFVTALCPLDVIVNVEGELIFEGKRSESVVINIYQHKHTRISLGTIIDDPQNPGFAIEPTKSIFASVIYSSRKLKCCLSEALDLVFMESNNIPELRHSVVDFIAALVFSFRGKELNPQGNFMRDGVKALLGPYAENRIRDKLSLYFGIMPSMTSIDGDSVSRSFLDLVEQNLGIHACASEHCLKPWNTECNRCPRVLAWKNICDIIGTAIILLFVEHTETKDWLCIMRGSQVGSIFCTAAVERAGRDHKSTPLWKSISEAIFHSDLLALTGRKDLWSVGICDQGSAIFPSSLLEPALQASQPLFTYIDADGQFCHEKRFYSSIAPCTVDIRPEAKTPVQRSISPSWSIHSIHTLTITPHLDTLQVRTSFRILGKTIEVNFLHLQWAKMALSFAEPCDHDNQEATVDTDPTIMPTSIAAPVAMGDFISLVGTHEDPEAQFLCGVIGVRTLFQGESCLQCTITYAKNNGFRMIIQS